MPPKLHIIPNYESSNDLKLFILKYNAKYVLVPPDQ